MALPITELRIPLEDVREATNNFDEANIISTGGFGPAYKGQLLRSGKSIKIAARTFRSVGELEFWTEVSVLSDLNHPNIVSLIGFCDEKGMKIIITPYAPKGSLGGFLHRPKLTWIRRLKLCLGVARALSYLHFDEGRRDYGVIHCNINSDTILLDENWEPKLSGFEISIKQPVNRMDRVIPCEALGAEEYMDPENEKTNGVTYKSDIYSFGVVLFEILCGRLAFVEEEAAAKSFLAPWVRYEYKNGTPGNIFNLRVLGKMSTGSQSVQKYLKIAIDCIEEERTRRPDMDKVVCELEKALEFQLPFENLRLNSKLLRIPLSDIKLATEDFSERYNIGRTEYFTWYRVELNHFNKEKRSNSVIVRRIESRFDREEVFFREAEMLTSFEHSNIAKLLGFCLEGWEMILVMENTPNENGYLADYLQDVNKKRILTWEKRLKICIDVSHALNYLHSEMEEQKKVKHYNISSQTIALNENWEAKIVEFGSRHYVDTSSVEGPELESSKSRKLDVYRFGMVLFGILFGKPAYNSHLWHSKESIDWDARACDPRKRFRKVTLEEMIDPIIKEEMGEHNFAASLNTFIKIAYQCLEEPGDRRPTMKFVVRELEKALSSYQEESGKHQDMDLNFEEFEKGLVFNLMHEVSEEQEQHSGKDIDVYEFKKAEELKARHEIYEMNSELLKISLAVIQSAIEDCDWGYTNGNSNYCVFLMAELHFDKDPSPVFIKRAIPRMKLFFDDKGPDFDVEKIGQFYTEVKMLTSVKHRNIASLLGFCDEGSEMILVMEDLSNGILKNHLSDQRKMGALSWETRLRICIDVAHALNYLHFEMEDQKMIINRTISSINIGLDKNFGAKIVDFRLAVFLPPNQEDEALYLEVSDIDREYEYKKTGKFKRKSDPSIHHTCDGAPYYIDPEYKKTGKLKRESDVYSFGVVMFEILCGRKADDPNYLEKSNEGLAFLARQCSNMGTLEEMIDLRIKVEIGEDTSSLNKGPEDSLATFIEIASKCVSETQDQRPTMKVVVRELEKALSLHEELEQHTDKDVDVYEFKKAEELKARHEIYLQEMNSELLKISLADIQSATEDFDWDYTNGNSNYCQFLIAELHFDKDPSSVFIKRVIPRLKIFFDDKGPDIDVEKIGQFYTEVKMLTSVKHRNIASLLGFYDEGSEMILVMEDLSNGILKNYLSDDGKMRALTWEKRLRICIDVAHALNYLHFEMEDQKMIINRTISSINVGLDKNFRAKIVDFRLAVFLPPNQEDEALYLEVSDIDREYEYKKTGKIKRKSDPYIHHTCDGAPYYIDPEYKKTGKLKRESDVYSFGVVMFEILCGRKADDPNYLGKSNEGLAFLARQCSNMGTLEEMIDPMIKEETGEYTFILNKGPNKDSLATFIEIASKCVSETQDQRPTMKVVVRELEKALSLHINKKNNPVISLEDIKLATGDFDRKNYIGGGGFGNVFKGKLKNGQTIVVKRLNDKGKQFTPLFLRELQISLEYKHKNVIGLVGYCDEKDEKILVYEYASRSSLDGYLEHPSLTWLKRLKICTGVASALDFFHGRIGTQAKVVHRDIKTANILLTHDWEAKLADFGLSLISPITKETDYVIDGVCGTEGYMDPLYKKSKFLTIESDIYSFGVVLFEILCGISTHAILKREGHYMPDFVKRKFEEGKREEVVFEQIRKEVVPESLTTFQNIAYRFLNLERGERPKSNEVLVQLKRALEFQISKEDRLHMNG